METVKTLRSLPPLGQAGRKEGTRELDVTRSPLVIVHRIDISDEDELVILGIYHGARDERAVLRQRSKPDGRDAKRLDAQRESAATRQRRAPNNSTRSSGHTEYASDTNTQASRIFSPVP